MVGRRMRGAGDMLRLVLVVLLALLPACGSVTERKPVPAVNLGEAGQPPPPADCAAAYQPETPEYQKCLEAQSASKWSMVYVMGGSLAVVLAAGFLFALSDENAKTDIVKVSTLDNGLSLYRFRYRWSDQQFVGVMAQEVQRIVPDAVARRRDGYLYVDYGKLGLAPMTWEAWQTGGYVYRPHPRHAAAVAVLPP